MQQRTHSHLRTTTFPPEQAAREGKDSAARTLTRLYQHPDVVNGTAYATELLANAAAHAREKGNYSEAAQLRCLAESTDYLLADISLSTATSTVETADRYGEEADEYLGTEIAECKEALLSGNEAIKEYLATHPDEPIEHLLEMMWTAAHIHAEAEYGMTIPEQVDKNSLLLRIRGMRGELSFEQILAKFEGITVHDTPTDTAERRSADKRGIDYVIDVIVQPINEQFTIWLDVKNNPQFTFDGDNNPIPGKIWNQCANTDYVNNSTTLDPSIVMYKAEPMQKALIAQLSLLRPAQLRAACKKHGIAPDDLYID